MRCISTHGDDNVSSDSHGKDFVERVVDVFPDNVDTARTASDELGGFCVVLLEAVEKIRPSLLLCRNGVLRVDNVDGEHGRNWFFHPVEVLSDSPCSHPGMM